MSEGKKAAEADITSNFERIFVNSGNEFKQITKEDAKEILLADCLKKGDTVEVNIASKEQAIACEDDTVVMTPYKTLLAIEEWGGSGTGGGGGGATIPTMSSSFTGGSFAVGETIEARYKWASPNDGNGILHVVVDNTEYQTQTVAQGVNRYELTGLVKGSHQIQMYVIDKGGLYTDTIKFIVKIGSLDITSSFDDSVDFGMTQIIKIPVTVDTISLEPVYMVRTIDNESVTLPAQNGYNIFQLPTLTSGGHKVSFQANSSVYVSNKLTFDIVVADTDSLTLLSDFDTTVASYKDLLEIKYRVSLKGETKFNAEYYIDAALYKTLTIPLGSNIWSNRDLGIGNHKLQVKVYTLDGTKSAELSWAIRIDPSDYAPLTPVQDASLIAWFDAAGKTNQDSDRETWTDKSGNGVHAEFHNLNYGNNGWIDGALVLNGGAYAVIDMKPLEDNCPYGITVDVRYKTRDVGAEEACVMDMRGSDSNNKGFSVDTRKMYLNSGTSRIYSDVEQEEVSRATFVVDREAGVAYIYNNGVKCEAFIMGKEEDFYNNSKIYLNARLGTVDGVWQPSIFGASDIYSVRVYARALSSDEIVQNLIADIQDLDEQKDRYDMNYNNAMPTMYFYGDTAAMTKDTKVPLRIKYISTDPSKYGESFDLVDCMVSWQGTSSLQYVFKNYKIKLRAQDGSKFKYTPFADGIPESTFCLKADYMESSHANNTGMAKYINDCLYEELTPPQKSNSKVRTTINGFPIQLYIAKDSVSEPVYMGVYNFNLDKSCNDSFGMDNTDEGFGNCCCFEASANSDVSAGAFRDDSMESIRADFEIQYPDEDDITAEELTAYYTRLQQVISWVRNSDETVFKSGLEQHFNKEYLIKYYLQAHMFGMIDNLGKNMFLRTWDGEVWYPTFYDLDSELGLDNTGYLKFRSDIDIVEGVYNTSGSKLFGMLVTCFFDDIKEAYKKLRGDGRYTVEKVMSYWYDTQVRQIGELQYNRDMEAKYIAYKNDYLFMMHGRRYEHLKKWLKERFLYLDTIYAYEADTSSSITVRANKAATISIDILTYSPQWLTVKWRNGDGGTQRLRCGRDADGNMTPCRFTGTLTTATDQEVIIYNAKQIKRIDGMANLNPSVLNFVEASKLTGIDCQGAKVLTDIRISREASYINNINLYNCTKLGTVAGTDSLDLSSLTNLTSLNVNGTSLSKIAFPPNGCNLKTLYVPNTLAELKLENMPLLTDINAFRPEMSYSSVYIKDCPNIDFSKCACTTQWHKCKTVFITSSIIYIDGVNFGSLSDVSFNYGGGYIQDYNIAGSTVTRDLTSLYLNNVDFSKVGYVYITCTSFQKAESTVQSFEIENSCSFNELILVKPYMIKSMDLDFTKLKKITGVRILKPYNIDNLHLPLGLNDIYIDCSDNEYYNNQHITSMCSRSGNMKNIVKKADNDLHVTFNGAGVDDSRFLDLSMYEITKGLYLNSKEFDTLTDIKINCDFTKNITSIDNGMLVIPYALYGYDYSKYYVPFENSEFGIRNTTKMHGKIKAENNRKSWVNAIGFSTEDAILQSDFNDLVYDITNASNIYTCTSDYIMEKTDGGRCGGFFNNWKYLESLIGVIGLKYTIEHSSTVDNFFRDTYSLGDIGELEGQDLNIKSRNVAHMFRAVGKNQNKVFTLGNITFSYDYTSADITDYFSYMFYDSSHIESVGNVDLGEAHKVNNMFNGNTSLKSSGNITGKNVTIFSTSFPPSIERVGKLSFNFKEMISMNSLFSNAITSENMTSCITEDEIDSIPETCTISGMFMNSNNIDGNALQYYKPLIEKVTGSISQLFDSSALSELPDLNLQSNNIDRLCYNCPKLSKVGVVTANNATTLQNIFSQDKDLLSIGGLIVPKARQAMAMFVNCNSLITISKLDITELTVYGNTTQPTNAQWFNGCNSLTHVEFVGEKYGSYINSGNLFVCILDAETIQSLYDAMDTMTTAITFTFRQRTYDALSADLISKFASKGITIARSTY